MATRDEWPCYDNTKPIPVHALKQGRQLDEKDIEALTALYQQLVVGDLLGRSAEGVRTRAVVVTLGTQDEHDIIPPDEFLQQVSVDSLVALPSSKSMDVPHCELRLWAWLAPDTARADATVMRHGGGVSRGAMIVRGSNGWTVCPNHGIGIIN
jgi:hypothetical protein